MTFREFASEIKVNGRLIDATVTITVSECEVEPYETSNEFAAQILVKATALNENGYDSLGGVIVPCNNMFDSKPFTEGIDAAVKVNDMVRIALDDLTASVESRIAQYRELGVI